jgi:hypothetical protein
MFLTHFIAAPWIASALTQPKSVGGCAHGNTTHSFAITVRKQTFRAMKQLTAMLLFDGVTSMCRQTHPYNALLERIARGWGNRGWSRRHGSKTMRHRFVVSSRSRRSATWVEAMATAWSGVTPALAPLHPATGQMPDNLHIYAAARDGESS